MLRTLLLFLLPSAQLAFQIADDDDAVDGQNYKLLGGVAYHNTLRRADPNDFVVVATVDEGAASFSFVEAELNRAVGNFRCLIDGGVHMMCAGGKDEMARFIAIDDGEPGQPALLPSISLFKGGERKTLMALSPDEAKTKWNVSFLLTSPRAVLRSLSLITCYACDDVRTTVCTEYLTRILLPFTGIFPDVVGLQRVRAHRGGQRIGACIVQGRTRARRGACASFYFCGVRRSRSAACTMLRCCAHSITTTHADWMPSPCTSRPPL